MLGPILVEMALCVLRKTHPIVCVQLVLWQSPLELTALCVRSRRRKKRRKRSDESDALRKATRKAHHAASRLEEARVAATAPLLSSPLPTRIIEIPK